MIAEARPCPCGSGRRLAECCQEEGFAKRFGQAILLHQQGRLDEAGAAYAQLRLAQPDNPDVIHYQGVVFLQRGEFPSAVSALEMAVAARPAQAAFRTNLAIALTQSGDDAAALAQYERVLAQDPGQHQCALYRVRLLERLHRPQEAMQALEALLRRAPEFVDGWLALADRCYDQANLDASFVAYGNALRLNPASPEALSGVGHLALRFGLIDQAKRSYDALLTKLRPGSAAWAQAWESRLFIMGHDVAEGDQLLAAHQEYSRQRPAPARVPMLRQRGDRLRVGYLSSDLREHAMRFFARPLLQSYSKERLDVLVFANHAPALADGFTQELRGAVAEWHDISALDDDIAAQRIREHRLDYLIDLNGYTANHRMGVLERQVATHQGTMLGYMATTGNPCIDFRVADAVALPPGKDVWFSEQIWRMPDSQWCFVPDADTPLVGDRPADRAGIVSFGCFHSAAKITDDVLAIYARILQRVPRSRIVFVVRGKHASDRLMSHFADQGLQGLVQFLPAKPYLEYLRYYDEIDIALDVFPYSGGTMSCESLWMGVPFVSLAFDSPAGRSGASILSAAGLSELIASSSGDFVEQCADLAADRARLRAYRRSLRQRLAASPLMDVGRYMRSFEDLLLSHA